MKVTITAQMTTSVEADVDTIKIKEVPEIKQITVSQFPQVASMNES